MPFITSFYFFLFNLLLFWFKKENKISPSLSHTKTQIHTCALFKPRRTYDPPPLPVKPHPFYKKPTPVSSLSFFFTLLKLKFSSQNLYINTMMIIEIFNTSFIVSYRHKQKHVECSLILCATCWFHNIINNKISKPIS